MMQVIAVEASNKTVIPNKDHPIYQVPKGFGNLLVQSEPFSIRDIRRNGKLIQRGCDRDIKWSFLPTKKQYLLGETITGKLTVEHTGPVISYKFSPPYHGAEVSTLSLWCSRWQQEGDKKGNWGPLKEIYQVNDGYYRSSKHKHSGKPIILGPGDRYETSVAINVLQTRSRLRGTGWYSGIGPFAPGKYRIYLRYINLNRIMDFPLRNNDILSSMKEEKRKNAFKISRSPLVMGPFNVEILPLNIPEEQEIINLLARWNGVVPVQYHFEQSGRDNFEYSDQLTMFDEISPDAIRVASKLKYRKCISVRQAFMLTDIRYRLYKNHKAKSSQKMKTLQELDRVVQKVLKEKLPRAVADAWKYTRCQILLEQNRKEEALQLAKETATPDMIVFILKHSTK